MTDLLAVPSMLIHEVTGTYLEMDNYVDNVGEAVQIWNLDPPKDAENLQGHKWLVVAKEDGYYLIKSFDHKRCLAASAVSAGDYPRIQECDGSEFQDWLFVGVENHPGTYAIIPRRYPEYALGIQNNIDANDRYVVPTRMWGKPTLFHCWRQSSLADANS